MRAGYAPLAVTILGVLLSGCGGDEPCSCFAVACADPFSLTVADASTLAPISDASGSSAGLSCSASGGRIQCDVGGAPGTYDVELAASGYVSKQFSVTVDAPPPPDECECPRCQGWHPGSATLERE